ncbi:MAG: hypothetical protein GDA48_08220 [Hormoscilla sp. GM102CHS1]|nr:hypothetical protein [Hormoscilla sp. GM102CHS1]
MNETWDETRDETILLMHNICGVAIESLAIITVNNPDVVRVLIDIKAIDTLRNWAQNSQDEEIRQMAAECLISISDGHP